VLSSIVCKNEPISFPSASYLSINNLLDVVKSNLLNDKNPGSGSNGSISLVFGS
jgi:hypothetical protein